jgi:hypothetical protein
MSPFLYLNFLHKTKNRLIVVSAILLEELIVLKKIP